MCQIRDDNHKPLEGIELGDLGTKVGDGIIKIFKYNLNKQ